MTPPGTLTLLINGLTLTLALSFLIIVLWTDIRKELYQFFAAFLLMVLLWHSGALLAQAALLLELPPDDPLLTTALGVMELGFTGSSVAIYALTAVLVKLGSRSFRRLAFLSLLVVVAYRMLLLLGGAPAAFSADEAALFIYRAPLLLVVFYLIFDGATLYMLWRYRGKIRSRALAAGIFLFVIGQSVGFLNPDLQAFTLAMTISAAATLLLAFALLRQEIIRPLADRNAQVEALRSVSLSITSQTERDTVLDQVAQQAAALLGADAVAVLLCTPEADLTVETVVHLPASYVGLRLAPGQGAAGQVAQTGQPLLLERYDRDWQGLPDLPLARETFGSVLCVPLVYGGRVIGVLMVIAARYGRVFDREESYLLQLLGAQASVAIAHSQLFEEQEALTQQVDFARGQLETVLTSTESPVIAVDRGLRLIFANPAAQALFSAAGLQRGDSIRGHLPDAIFPPKPLSALRTIRQRKACLYEVPIGEHVYQCHLAALGSPRLTGFVAVLNDVTQLKELDRMKSEMVRMTSHDLKNPLQAAMANLELLRDDVYAQGTEDVRISVDAIDTHLQRMLRIIRGILDLERVRDGRLALEPYPPGPLITTAADDMAHLAAERRVTLSVHAPDDLPQVQADGEQLGRALVNLIENAIKFTPEGGRVSVSAAVRGAELIIAVSDTGVGIQPELQSRVFERFFRAKQRGVEHVSGSGLGLSLVKAIVERHQGRVWLDSVESVGTTAFIALPLGTSARRGDSIASSARDFA